HKISNCKVISAAAVENSARGRAAFALRLLRGVRPLFTGYQSRKAGSTGTGHSGDEARWVGSLSCRNQTPTLASAETACRLKRCFDGELAHPRSEERRVGKECRSRWSPDHEKKKEEYRKHSVAEWRREDITL